MTVEFGEKDAFVRRVAKVETLGNAAERQHFHPRLCRGRLLMTDRDEENRSVVQVAHEAFFTHWPRLQQMLQADLEFLRRRARATAAFGLWEEQNRDSSYLWWSGKLLAEAKALLSRSEELDARGKEFARASVPWPVNQRSVSVWWPQWQRSCSPSARALAGICGGIITDRRGRWERCARN